VEFSKCFFLQANNQALCFLQDNLLPDHLFLFFYNYFQKHFRDNLKIMRKKEPFRNIVETSINQTLGRTLLTTATTLLAVLALFLFGGSGINDFAFTFLVGILTGTYSSIYIASAFVLWWHKGVRPKTGSQVVMQETAVAAQP